MYMKLCWNYYIQTSSLVFIFNFFLMPPFIWLWVKKEESRKKNSHVLQKSLKLATNLFPFGWTFQIWHQFPKCKTFIILMILLYRKHFLNGIHPKSSSTLIFKAWKCFTGLQTLKLSVYGKNKDDTPYDYLLSPMEECYLHEALCFYAPSIPVSSHLITDTSPLRCHLSLLGRVSTTDFRGTSQEV